MNGIHYIPNVLNLSRDQGILNEINDLNWCRPPSGLPGNRTPRNVAVLGDGSKIIGINQIKETNLSLIGNTSYPLFQTSKDSYGIYKMNRIPKHLSNFIVKLRKLVQIKYGKQATNIDSMFNVIVCNYYTESHHQISAHRDDERWLIKNIENNGSRSSLIASLTIYPDNAEPENHRKFEMLNEVTNKWQNYKLENGSVIFFSNEMHRAKALSKKTKNVKRINLTFRTLHPDILGLIGYGNFYRYMSLPYEISICDNKINIDKLRLFFLAIDESNQFTNKNNFKSANINHHSKNTILTTKKTSDIYHLLPRYIKSLCTHINLDNIANSLIIKYKIKFNN